MPKQEFEFVDYLGPLAVSVCFAVILFFLSLIINFIWITKEDDRTVFEKAKFVDFKQKLFNCSNVILKFETHFYGNFRLKQSFFGCS